MGFYEDGRYVPVYPCAGCGRETRVDEMKKAWVRSPLGNSVVHAHPGCEWAALEARERTAGGPVKVIPEPLTAEERALRREAAEREQLDAER